MWDVRDTNLTVTVVDVRNERALIRRPITDDDHRIGVGNVDDLEDYDLAAGTLTQWWPLDEVAERWPHLGCSHHYVLGFEHCAECDAAAVLAPNEAA